MILDPTGSEIKKPLPLIKSVEPCGSQILVEFLTAQEQVNTMLEITGTDSKVPLQGYILAIGPAVEAKNYGFKVGDRFVFSGHGVEAPNVDNSSRTKMLVEPHSIKAVLRE